MNKDELNFECGMGDPVVIQWKQDGQILEQICRIDDEDDLFPVGDVEIYDPEPDRATIEEFLANGWTNPAGNKQSYKIMDF